MNAQLNQGIFRLTLPMSMVLLIQRIRGVTLIITVHLEVNKLALGQSACVH